MTRTQAVTMAKKLRAQGMNYSEAARLVSEAGYNVSSGGLHRWLNPLKPGRKTRTRTTVVNTSRMIEASLIQTICNSHAISDSSKIDFLLDLAEGAQA